jgi:hypothetical protein
LLGVKIMHDVVHCKSYLYFVVFTQKQTLHH